MIHAHTYTFHELVEMRLDRDQFDVDFGCKVLQNRSCEHIHSNTVNVRFVSSYYTLNGIMRYRGSGWTNALHAKLRFLNECFPPCI